MNQRLTDQAIAERRSWQYRAIAYAKGNQSQIGALLIAIMGRVVNPPCIHPRGMRIMADGRCIVLAKKGVGERWNTECVYNSVDEFNTAFRGLAEILKLDEADRQAMFAELRKFVFHDARAKSFLPGVTNEDGSPIK